MILLLLKPNKISNNIVILLTLLYLTNDGKAALLLLCLLDIFLEKAHILQLLCVVVDEGLEAFQDGDFITSMIKTVGIFYLIGLLVCFIASIDPIQYLFHMVLSLSFWQEDGDIRANNF